MATTWNQPDLTESGLLDKVEVSIDNAFFATDGRYNNGATVCFQVEGKWRDPVTGETGSTDSPILYPVGEDWASHDGGKTVAHPRGKEKFNKNSGYGMLLDRAVALGAREALAERGNGPTDARSWVGLRFYFEREEKDYKGDIGKRERLLPQKFLGTADGQAASAAAPASTPATGDVLVVLEAIAREAASQGDFVQKAIAVPGHESFMAEIVDKTNGIYARIKST